MSGLAIAFTGSQIDRADHIRGDTAALAGLMTYRARLLRMKGLDPLLSDQGELVWSSLADADPAGELVFLGLMDGRGHFAEVPLQGAGGLAPPSRNALAMLSAPELAAYGTARALVSWHARHRFCAQCGSPTTLAKGGWQRNCTSDACRAEHFPRTDPVTIMIVEHEGRLLLGRQPRFAPKFYSALAGFVEPGESIEEAVKREVFEEAGVRARDVTYVASQPWPYPSSLMIGCHAYADDPEIVIDTTELDDARWFSRAEIASAMAGEPEASFGVPPHTAIAHQLLKWWLARG